ncbi:MAG: vanadium-dependent haloperoxidase [Colwellia sp.]|nr:vanadium-dependent haloperoxidase [Colwellia sp.]
MMTCLVITACNSDNKSSEDEIIDETITVERTGESVARQWNEVLLHAIRNDFARPTVHARNLFHISSAMFDAWAVYDDKANTYLFNNKLGDFECSGQDFDKPIDILPEREQALSFAAYRIIEHRFKFSPGVDSIMEQANSLMLSLGYDSAMQSTDYSQGDAASLGNYIANCYIDFGWQDGANESQNYINKSYLAVNAPLVLDSATVGNPTITDLDRWQPLSIAGNIDQAGNPVQDVLEFLGPEWGQVTPFALSDNDKTTFNRDGYDYQVYFDPGMPATINGELSEEYKWSFSMVAVWSAHLSTDDEVMWDISPKSLGNIQSLPNTFAEHHQFYNYLEGGDASTGYEVNPKTGSPYQEQMVKRGDYVRVLAEFWADGPSSETPPGHWFVILNTVSDHPQLEKRWAGEGDVVGNLEWDIKTYFAMGGTMHDSAVTAWGIKGRYDYIRPVSAVRAMADLGQSSDINLPSYHVNGLPLVDGYIELVSSGDNLSGENNEHLGKVKLFAWKGPDYINDPSSDQAGVGWILAENWWPYQRPTFVTPPFAGYVSGHSTFSRAAAELMTAMTGDEYFPGGMSEFEVKANDFLVFEEGPSTNMTLQWATYRDASDQCSLSRIWGGIHPAIDDIPGRLIGEKIGVDSFNFAQNYFNGTAL